MLFEEDESKYVVHSKTKSKKKLREKRHGSRDRIVWCIAAMKRVLTSFSQIAQIIISVAANCPKIRQQE